MIVISIERACNILSKIVKNITWLPNTSSYIFGVDDHFFKDNHYTHFNAPMFLVV